VARIVGGGLAGREPGAERVSTVDPNRLRGPEGMASRGFSRVEEVYVEALGRSPAERNRFLEEACAGNAALLHEVRSLLSLAEAAAPFLEESASAATTREFHDLKGCRLGPYEVRDRIGTGGMGEVYRARDTRLERDIAIKVLPGTAAGDDERRRRLEREARSAAALNHPNIATVYEIGEHEGILYIAMELIEGRTLKDRLATGPLSVPELLALAVQIARGLAKAHGAGIVHRDLKPGNLMVTGDGLVKILDFGLARRAPRAAGPGSGITREGAVLGTVEYMSPEQATARPIDHRSDQFALGAILYEMATGRRTFERATIPQTLAAVIEGEPVPVRKVNPGIPVELAAIVERCLAKDPERRFEETADLARALELASATAAATGRPARGWWMTGLAAVALVAALALLRYSPRSNVSETLDAVPDVVPLTAYPGSEDEPTFSPDGSQVAFTWDGDDQDNPDIYVKTVGSERPLRLTADPARDGSPAWSPDGTRIAFLREKSGGGSELLLVPPVGGPERRLADVQGRPDEGLAWSPDSRSLAVVDRSSPAERCGIFLLDAADGTRRRLTSPPAPSFDAQPAFSPDGRTVAFRRPPIFGVFLVSTAGGDPRPLVEGGDWRTRLAWAPGGREIILAAERLSGRGQRPLGSEGGAGVILWRVPIDGSPARPLRFGVNAASAAVSRDGRRLAYSQGTADLDIWRLDLRPRETTRAGPRRFIASTRMDANPQFSPDGTRVAFTSARNGHGEIWVVDGSGGNALQLTSLGRGGEVGAPRWSPDGESVAFEFGPIEGTNVDVYVVDSSGGPPRRVTSSDAIDAMPSWSRDGRWIYFGSNRSGDWQVWKVPSSGEEPGSARQVTRHGGFAAVESTDGASVYFSRKLSGRHDPQNAIWRLPVGGGDEEAVVESFRAGSGSWDVTAWGIYFVDRSFSPGEEWVVRFLAFGQHGAKDVARLAHPPYLAGPAVSVSPDGRWLLSTQSQGEFDLMLVEGFQ
jgi:Tol biopolymer transport system component/predicted Ser/Thr protein kinase